jgi:peptide/nickel transport system ATP-binding protein
VQRRRRMLRSPTPRVDVLAPATTACPFAMRCPHTISVCQTERPALEHTERGTRVACHRWRELDSIPSRPSFAAHAPPGAEEASRA